MAEGAALARKAALEDMEEVAALARKAVLEDMAEGEELARKAAAAEKMDRGAARRDMEERGIAGDMEGEVPAETEDMEGRRAAAASDRAEGRAAPAAAVAAAAQTGNNRGLAVRIRCVPTSNRWEGIRLGGSPYIDARRRIARSGIHFALAWNKFLSKVTLRTDKQPRGCCPVPLYSNAQGRCKPIISQ
jgi:hypothetical protein